jgi:hypothetical protein
VESVLKCSILACAGLALSIPAYAQTQQYLMVPNTTNGVMLLNPQDGSIAVTSFIPKVGPAWNAGISVLKAAVQVGDEIWISVQANDTIWRFDLNGKYYGKLTQDIRNTRGMCVLNGTVYVTNSQPSGATTAAGVVKFTPSGSYQGFFPNPSGTGTAGNWDIAVSGSTLYVSDDTTIQRFDTAGTPLGAFGPTFGGTRQIVAKAGNFLVANAGTAGTYGLYELDATGAQVRYINTGTTTVTGLAELGNGNFVYSGSNLWLYNTAAASSTQIVTGSSQFITPLTVNTAASGACCFLDGTCATRTISQCGAENGVFRGDATVCASASCPPSGACCMPDATCSLLPVDFCTTASGLWAGAGTACATANCHYRLITPNTSLTASTAGNGIFFDLTPGSDISVFEIDYVPGTSAGTAVTVDLYTRNGTYVGFDTDPSAWTLAGTFNTTSLGNTSSSPHTPLVLQSPIGVGANQTLGVYLVGTAGGYRYRSSTSPNPVSDANLSLTSDLGRSTLFGGTASTGRRFGGTVHYRLGVPQSCYANCDASTAVPFLNVADFSCFLTRFASQDPFANCDGSTTAPTLNVADFTCFLSKFAAGCSAP